MAGVGKHGAGGQGVVILNDRLSDTSTWDKTRPCLGCKGFTRVIADLRGYGAAGAEHRQSRCLNDRAELPNQQEAGRHCQPPFRVHSRTFRLAAEFFEIVSNNYVCHIP